MKLSVITCTYNSVSTLAANIASVQKQSWSDWEHIFVDGFSVDGTKELLENYQKEFPDKVKIFFSQPRGISAAMNEGIRQATGDYLIHLHADDSLFDNQVLSDVADFLSAHPVDWIYGRINTQEEDGRSLGLFPIKSLWQQGGQSALASYLLKFYNYIPHQAVFIKPQVFAAFGYFDESLSSAMDPDLWLRIKDKTKWTFYSRTISNFSLRPGAVSSGLKNRSQSEANARLVQSRYLNAVERVLAGVINWLLKFKNNNYR